MKANYHTCIKGEKVILVPYRSDHVDTYHQWMQDEYLLDATGSEPLSMEEEIKMQQEWRDDELKCTFIVLSLDKCTSIDFSIVDTNEDFIQDTIESMCGDVNLFLSDEEDESDSEDEDFTRGQDEDARKQAELDIMIAAEDCRGKGLGKEAVCLMMLYGAQNLDIRRFVVKIKEDNIASRALFSKLGFVQCNYAECFKEVELEFKRDSSDDVTKEIQVILETELIQQWQIPSKPSI